MGKSLILSMFNNDEIRLCKLSDNEGVLVLLPKARFIEPGEKISNAIPM